MTAMKKAMVFFALVFAVMGSAIPRSQQNDGPHKQIYDTVPPDHRESLRKLVNQMTELEKQRQWDKIYDLIATPYRMGSREEFARSYARTSRLIDFEVSDAI